MDVSRRVTEIRLDSTEQRLESWRCMMGIAGGMCLVAIPFVLLLDVLAYFNLITYDPRHVLWTSLVTILLFGVVATILSVTF